MCVCVLCVFASYIGMYSMFSQSPHSRKIEVLEKTQHLPSNQGRVLHFMWVDLRCHTSFGAALGITLESVPALVAISPKKAVYAKFINVFAPQDVAVFIGKFLNGKAPFVPFKGFPSIEGEDCQALYSAQTVSSEPEIDLADLMGMYVWDWVTNCWIWWD